MITSRELYLGPAWAWVERYHRCPWMWSPELALAAHNDAVRSILHAHYPHAVNLATHDCNSYDWDYRRQIQAALASGKTVISSKHFANDAVAKAAGD